MSEYAALRVSVMDSPPHSPTHSPTHAGSSDWSGSSSSPNSGASPPPTSASGTGTASTTPESEEFVPKTSALRSTATATVEDNANANVNAPTRTRRGRRNEEEKERQQFSNLFRASTAKIGSELDLALETGKVDVSLERSVREERFAHVRLVGGWNWGGTATWGRGLGGGGDVAGRMGFKYDPRALREAVFGYAAGGLKRRKVTESTEVGGNHTQDRGDEAKREDVVLLAENAASERVVFVYRGLRPPSNVDKDKNRNAANPALAIGSKRPREEEQDEEEYRALYDVFRERRVTTSAPPTAATATTTTTTTSGTSTATSTEGTTTKGVRFAAGSKLDDGGGKPQRRRRPGAGSESSNGKVTWRRTLVMRNVCESDVEFGKDGVCLWIKVSPPVSVTKAAAAAKTSSSPTSAPPASAFPGGGGSGETESRLTRLEVEYDGTPTPPTAGSKSKKDARRGVVFPCKVWRWRAPPRVTRPPPRAQKLEGANTNTNADGTMEMKMETATEMEVEV